jgi:hypothetical protein
VSCFYVNHAFNAIISNQKPIKQKTASGIGSGRFLFVSCKAQILLLTAFVFSGVNYTNGNENEQQRAKFQAREGNGNGRTQRNTAHGLKFRCFSAFSRLGGTLGRVQRLKRNASDF